MSRRLVDRILFGQHYDYQAVIHSYSQAISNILYLSELANVALGHIDKTLGVARGAFFIVESDLPQHFYLRSLPAMGTNGLPRSITLSSGLHPGRNAVASQ